MRVTDEQRGGGCCEHSGKQSRVVIQGYRYVEGFLYVKLINVVKLLFVLDYKMPLI